MILASVLDPDLFHPDHFDGTVTAQNYTAALIQHLSALRHCHVLLVDTPGSAPPPTASVPTENDWRKYHHLPERSEMLSEIDRNLANRQVPEGVRRGWRVLRNLKRLLQYSGLGSSASVKTPTAPPLTRGSALAVAIGKEEPDASLLLSPRTANQIGAALAPSDRIHSLCDYPGTTLFARQESYRRGFNLVERKAGDVDDLLRPILRWASHVRIMDKQIGTAFAQSTSWGRFKQAVQNFYNLWKPRDMNSGTFYIITEVSSPSTDRPRQSTSPHERPFRDERAKRIFEDLELDPTTCRVVIKGTRTLFHNRHDRYLWTNTGIVVGFSSGFDFASPDDGTTSGPCDVYLRDEGDINTFICAWTRSDEADGIYPRPPADSRWAELDTLNIGNR